MTKISKIWTDNKMIFIQTENGKVFGEKFENYPLLRAASPQQRNTFTYNNLGIRWDDLDEDFSYSGFMTKEKEIFELQRRD
jgi:glutamine cyclotransferase